MDRTQLRRSSSEIDDQSPLVRLFARRVGVSNSGEVAIRTAVEQLRRSYRRRGSVDQRMQFYLKKRGIRHIEIVQDLDCDGALNPLGSVYTDGFKVLLRRHSSPTRSRFTTAHEICHTFFYEFVPELKFVPHDTDRAEELLCDLGAAELLMPTASVQKAAARLSVCTDSLRGLAMRYSVSAAAMFLRLRSLRLWNCVFSEWHRLLNGKFVLAKFYGGKAMPWEWEDKSILDTAWQSNRGTFGHTFVRYHNDVGACYYAPACFEVRRFGNRILSLWGADIAKPPAAYPLLDASLN